MSSTNTNSLHIARTAASIAAALVVICLGATPSSARPDPGPYAPPTDHPGGCQLQRVRTQFVSCDNLTGNGVAAPGWIPHVGSEAIAQTDHGRR